MPSPARRRSQRSDPSSDVIGLPLTGTVGPAIRAALGKLGRHQFGSRTIKRGAFGWDVSVLQFLLTLDGFDLGLLDGSFGPSTRAAVVAFQRDSNLVPDGIVGPATRAALCPTPGCVSTALTSRRGAAASGTSLSRCSITCPDTTGRGRFGSATALGISASTTCGESCWMPWPCMSGQLTTWTNGAGRAAADEIRVDVCTNGTDIRGVFCQHYDIHRAGCLGTADPAAGISATRRSARASHSLCDRRRADRRRADPALQRRGGG